MDFILNDSFLLVGLGLFVALLVLAVALGLMLLAARRPKGKEYEKHGKDEHPSPHSSSHGGSSIFSLKNLMIGAVAVILLIGLIWWSPWNGWFSPSNSTYGTRYAVATQPLPERVDDKCTGEVQEDLVLTADPFFFIDGCDAYYDVMSGVATFKKKRGAPFTLAAGERRGEHGLVESVWAEGGPATITIMFCPRGSKTDGWRCV